MAAVGTVDRGLADPLASRAKLVPGLDARLALIDADAGVDKFHVLQGIEDPELPDGPDRYYCFQRWGDTGGRGQTRTDGPMALPKVESLIAKVFGEKTGESWGSVEPGHRAQPGMYWLQQLMKPDAQARWEYFVNDGVDGKAEGWYPYVPDAAVEVEELYAQHVANGCDARTSSRTIRSGYFSYKVDLARMKQTNVRTSKVRDIRRVFGATGERRGGVVGRVAQSLRPHAMRVKTKRVRAGSALLKVKPASKVKAKAMKVKLPKKVAHGKHAKALVWKGKHEKTKKGLRKADLMKNKDGKIVSKKKSASMANNKWIKAVVQARLALAITGFCAVGGASERGKALYAKAKSIHSTL